MNSHSAFSNSEERLPVQLNQNDTFHLASQTLTRLYTNYSTEQRLSVNRHALSIYITMDPFAPRYTCSASITVPLISEPPKQAISRAIPSRSSYLVKVDDPRVVRVTPISLLVIVDSHTV